MDSFIKLTIQDGIEEEALIGLLYEHPFIGFMEDGQDLIAYMSLRDWTDMTEFQIREIVEAYCDHWHFETIPFENWNQQWEKNYAEVEIDDFCRIYAPFHSGPAQQFKYEILISPQMAFGTGHHATTEMMIRLMSHIPGVIQDGAGLDFGAGSGILAILASKMGASHVDAVEIDEYAFQNLEENISLNEADWIESFQGGMEVIPSISTYKFIVANVTKSIIRSHAQDFYNRLKPGGRIIVSGILDTDQDEVVYTYVNTGFFGMETMKIGKWTALLFGRK